MMTSHDDITNKEILEAIHAFSVHVNSEIGGLKSGVGSLKSDVSSLKSDVGSLKSEVKDMNTRLTRVESEMVAKDYLDHKLWDLQGDMVAMTRREIERHEARFQTATG